MPQRLAHGAGLPAARLNAVKMAQRATALRHVVADGTRGVAPICITRRLAL
jgi:hypothetical protein